MKIQLFEKFLKRINCTRPLYEIFCLRYANDYICETLSMAYVYFLYNIWYFPVRGECRIQCLNCVSEIYLKFVLYSVTHRLYRFSAKSGIISVLYRNAYISIIPLSVEVRYYRTSTEMITGNEFNNLNSPLLDEIR